MGGGVLPSRRLGDLGVVAGEHCGVKATVRLAGTYVGPKSFCPGNGLLLLALRHLVSLPVSIRHFKL